MEIRIDDWDKLPTQKKLYNDNVTNTMIFSGGLGSGKSYVLCRKLLKLSALNHGHPGGLLCPTYKDFRRDIKPLMEDILEEQLGLKKNIHWWFHNTHYEYSFTWNKKPLYVLTGEKPIAGPNLAYMGINEYSLIPFERINEALRRVRLKNPQYKQRILVGTPEDMHGWLEDFIEGQEERNKISDNAFRIFYADTRENVHIDEEYRAYLESILDEQALKVFASGQIVKLGSDYFYYSFDRSKNCDASIKHQDGQVVHVGLDFNVGRMCASFSHKVIYNGRAEQHFFGEIELLGDSNTFDMAEAIKHRFGTSRVVITCDASGASRSTVGKKGIQSDVQILRTIFPHAAVRYKSANTRLRKRQLLVNGLMSNGIIKVNPETCPKLVKDWEKVRQNKTDFNKIKTKDDKLTHFSDGADYVLDYEFELPSSHKFDGPFVINR